MLIDNITVQNLRNLLSIQLKPSPHINILCGNNGSGKTSFLEAIYLLTMGRSFRSYLSGRLINFNADFLLTSASFSGNAPQSSFTIGVKKQADGTTVAKLNGNEVHAIAELSTLCPMQLLSNEIYALLEQGPKFRRRFIDWGVFHVEHQFYELWKRYHKVLKQRNAALRQNLPARQVNAWTDELVPLGDILNSMRVRYLNTLLPKVSELMNTLLGNLAITIRYYPGWDEKSTLAETIHKDQGRDRELGYTSHGPHQADLKLTMNKHDVKFILSRGQQKLLLSAMKIAQGMMLKSQCKKNCIYLVDDLAAELDSIKQQNMLELLGNLQSQIFITNIVAEQLQNLLKTSEYNIFPIENGNIAPLISERTELSSIV